MNHYLIISTGLLWSITFLNTDYSKYSSRFKNWVNLSNKIPRFALVVVPILIVVSSIFFVNSFYEKTDSNNEIKIGVLLGLSGASYESGKTQKAVLLQGVKDINENFSNYNVNKRVVCRLKVRR